MNTSHCLVVVVVFVYIDHTVLYLHVLKKNQGTQKQQQKLICCNQKKIREVGFQQCAAVYYSSS